MIEDIFDKVNLHKRRCKSALLEIQQWKELDTEIFER